MDRTRAGGRAPRQAGRVNRMGMRGAGRWAGLITISWKRTGNASIRTLPASAALIRGESGPTVRLVSRFRSGVEWTDVQSTRFRLAGLSARTCGGRGRAGGAGAVAGR